VKIFFIPLPSHCPHTQRAYEHTDDGDEDDHKKLRMMALHNSLLSPLSVLSPHLSLSISVPSSFYHLSLSFLFISSFPPLQAGQKMYAQLLKALLIDGNLEEAKKRLAQFLQQNQKTPKSLEPELYHAIINVFLALRDFDSCLRIYNTMQLEGVQVPRTVFHTLIRACRNIQYLKTAVALFVQMQSSSDQSQHPSEATYAAMICVGRADVGLWKRKLSPRGNLIAKGI